MNSFLRGSLAQVVTGRNIRLFSVRLNQAPIQIMDATVVLQGTKEHSTNLLAHRFLYGGLIPGVEKNTKPIIIKENCYRIEREPLLAVNFNDFIVDLKQKIALKYNMTLGDIENPICTFDVDYYMLDNGDGTTTCRRNTYNFVQMTDPDMDCIFHMRTKYHFESQQMVDACEELRK